ncbi:hypothetical protein KY289_029673 [Solanum tuberosum]|nr:hypothetical protein KY289_029673 [Solanum tuberosum]
MSSADINILCSMIKVTAGNKKIGIRSALLEEKALTCHMLCCFAAELKEMVHLWVVSALVLNLTFEFNEEVRMVAIFEFVGTMAENREIGCGMMEIVPKEEVTKLLNVLIMMLVHIEDDPCWGNAISDDENKGELNEHKVDIAAMYLEGDALDLFSWINRERTLLYWEELEYHQEFAKRSSRVTDWLDHCLLRVFMNGLKEELKSDVRIHKPRTVYKAMSLTMKFEQKVSSNHGHKSQWSNLSRSNTIQTGSAHDVPYQSVGNQHVSRTNPNSTQMSSRPSPNRAWEIEKQNRIAKGLCFRCNEKFAPGHRCKTSSLTLMEANDNIEGGESGEQMSSDIIDGDAGTNDLAEISFHAFLGNTTGTIMKLQGTLNGHRVLLLVDSGSSHNFISEKIVEELQLPAQVVPYLRVQIGNGDIIRCNRLCQNLVVKFPRLTIDQDFYPFSVGGADLVLGIKWLASLNTVQANWNEMFLIFNLNGKRYKLQEVPQESNAPVAFQYFSKEADTSALQIWKHYLLGHHFYVRSDHCSLKYLLSQRITTNEQQRLLMKLLPFDFTIVYKAGKDNLGADSLSRSPLNAEFLALAILVPMDCFNWQNSLQADTYTREIIQAIHHDPSLQPDFHLVDQKLYFKETLVVPDQSSIRQKLLSESHDTPYAGHVGYLKTLKRLSSNFFCPRMKHDVKIFVQNCLVCQQAKYQALAPAGLLQSLPELFRLSQTRLRMGTSYHPQSDGQTEVVNRCLELYLRCFVMEQPRT